MMDADFRAVRVHGGMFSPEFLYRLANADAGVEGCDPSEMSTEETPISDLRRHFAYLWSRALSTWERFGPQDERRLGASQVRGFVQRLMDDLDHPRGEGAPYTQSTPQIWKEFAGSLWHVVSAEASLDERSEVRGNTKMSPHNLVQGALTASDDHVWGFVSNGTTLRLLRSTNRTFVQASLEFDMETMFNEGCYLDFCLFVMLMHRSRWPTSSEAPYDCWLERWFVASSAEGLAALDDLRKCVEEAANAFGSGLVRFRAGNEGLRNLLRENPEVKEDLRREIMRFLYRMIFVFVMEDRGMLIRQPSHAASPEEASSIEVGRERYLRGYATSRHRSGSLDPKATGHHADLYEELKVVLRSLYAGEPRLAIPALGSYLFSTEATPLLNDATVLNRDMIRTYRKLCLFQRGNGPLQRVHWRTLRETELGSVYESLLELRPEVDLENGTFTLVNAAGNDRKSSGSYYTPHELVDHLVTTTIDPLIEEAKAKARSETGERSSEGYRHAAIEHILKLTVCDPACGSGHFLIAALERIAMELARLEMNEEHPANSKIQRWKREASSRCIFGVDLQPTAVELCKLAIWMDTYDGQRPLSVLDGHIKQGNSLLGQRLEKLGLLPDEAIPKAWKEERRAHKAFNRARLKTAARAITTEIENRERRLVQLEQPRASGLFTLERPEGDADAKRALRGELAKLKEDLDDANAVRTAAAVDLTQSVDLQSVLRDIAATQAELTLGREDSLNDVEAKEAAHRSTVSDERFQWAKEVLDASIAMWWWPDPEDDEFGQRAADPPAPLGSMDFFRYAAWLAHEMEVDDDVLPPTTSGGREAFEQDETRFLLIKEHTARIAHEQSFFHWELEFAEVFAQED